MVDHNAKLFGWNCDWVQPGQVRQNVLFVLLQCSIELDFGQAQVCKAVGVLKSFLQRVVIILIRVQVQVNPPYVLPNRNRREQDMTISQINRVLLVKYLCS